MPELRGVDPLPVGPDGLICSAKGCRAEATTDLQWQNPKIHTPDRRKHWLACDQHRDSLGAFLSSRAFLRDTLPL
ncbi:acetone carboxylase [uncultured Friedmanniella sp.]|uniref:acetone carboxylase n=1 Tax=uncultured Friedmanniella sp. TaxID=335381 RepID=UPI0035CBFF31